MLDKITAQNLKEELKIDLFTIYREYLQLLFLKYLYSQKGSEKIYFKGGTALRFLYGSFRFSQDLDFTSLAPETKIKVFLDKTILNLARENVEVTFKKIRSFPESFSGKLSQRLPDFNFPLTVRLDFSLREKPLAVRTSYLETVFPIGPYPPICHLADEELLAEKVRAILTRVRGRDIFDFWFLLSKKVSLDWKLINQKMALYQKTATLVTLTDRIKKFPQEEIKNDLTKFLPFTHRQLVGTIKLLTIEKLMETVK